jgi:hypothetical protein
MVVIMGWRASYAPAEPANSLVRGGASLVRQRHFVIFDVSGVNGAATA